MMEKERGLCSCNIIKCGVPIFENSRYCQNGRIVRIGVLKLEMKARKAGELCWTMSYSSCWNQHETKKGLRIAVPFLLEYV